MSTSLMYHGFGIVGYHYQKTEFVTGQIHFYIHQHWQDLRCPVCNKKNVVRKGTVTRRFLSMPIGRKPIRIILPVQRIYCRLCKVVRQAEVGFADPQKSYTRAFERYVLALSHFMTIKDIADLLGVTWDTIKAIQKENLQKRYDRPRLKGLKQIAIDEICIGKGHRYLTIVLDLESGAVVFVGDGKGSDALDPFWARLKRSRAKVDAVAIDMSNAYFSAVTENLEEATIVFDHFHLVKLLNDKLTTIRRQLYNELDDEAAKDTLKGTRWLLLKNSENLSTDKDEKQRLEKALELNRPLAAAYYLKEDFKQIWKQPDKLKAELFLKSWVQRAKATGIAILQKFAQRVSAYRTGILAWYDHRISTGPLEGTNNKIKTLQKKAYGYRDIEFFKLKIKAVHLSRYALIG